MIKRLYFAMFAVAASVLSIAPAFAQDALSETVGYADLNLSQPTGRSVLQHRVSAAINDVCGTADIKDLQAFADVKKCHSAAVASTNAQIAAIVSKSQTASRSGSVSIASR